MSELERNDTNSTDFKPGNPYVIDIEEVDVTSLRSHPDNTYEMDPEKLQSLAENIHEVGLIELPLVREVTDGGYQIISGHRRVAAMKKIAKTDDRFKTSQVRVAHGMSDADALLILHSANVFRPVSQEERLKQVEHLRAEIKSQRDLHPEWEGMQTTAIIASLLGIPVDKYYRQMRLAKELTPDLYDYYNSGLMSQQQALNLATQPTIYQDDVAKYLAEKKPKDKKEFRQLLDGYETNISDLLDEFDKNVAQLDQTLFKIRDAYKHKRGQRTYIDPGRLESVRDKINGFLKDLNR